MRSIVFTHKGKRDTNQDFVLVQNLNPKTFLFLVADGMGGYEHGEIASQLISENIHAYLSSVPDIDSNHVQKAINKGNLAIRQYKEKTGSKLGATIGGVVITSDEALCFWVGDVKVFHFNKKKFQRESHSHTLMNEMLENSVIIDTKQLSKYKHVVTRSVQGEVNRSKIDFFKIEPIDNRDVFLICSDGVTDIYSGMQIQHILDSAKSYHDAMNIIEQRLLKEAKDNFSMILIHND